VCGRESFSDLPFCFVANRPCSSEDHHSGDALQGSQAQHTVDPIDGLGNIKIVLPERVADRRVRNSALLERSDDLANRFQPMDHLHYWFHQLSTRLMNIQRPTFVLWRERIITTIFIVPVRCLTLR
jgi:hypothetical protein